MPGNGRQRLLEHPGDAIGHFLSQEGDDLETKRPIHHQPVYCNQAGIDIGRVNAHA